MIPKIIYKEVNQCFADFKHAESVLKRIYGREFTLMKFRGIVVDQNLMPMGIMVKSECEKLAEKWLNS